MYRWSRCPGSVALSKGVESTSSPYALEGTKAHELAEKILKGEEVDGDYSEEIRSAVSVYTDYIFSLVEKGAQLHVEKRVVLDAIDSVLFGTADAILIQNDVVEVVDYKNGAGIAVEVEENTQMLYYALGAVMCLPVTPNFIRMTIVQPRCPHPCGSIRSWEVNYERLIEFSFELEEAVARTKKKDAPLIPGDHCRFCPAAAHCPELGEKAIESAKEAFTEIKTYDKEKLKKTLDLIPQLESYIKAVREFAYQEATRGRAPRGYKLVAKRAMRKWNSEVAKDIERLVGAEAYVKTLRSPAQVEKLLDKKDKKKLDPYVSKVSSGYSLVPSSDARKEILLGAENVFNVIEEKKEEKK